jgi:hypothetical protein
MFENDNYLRFKQLKMKYNDLKVFIFDKNKYLMRVVYLKIITLSLFISI